ncbi:hypothetical protein KP509_03G040600 [Ceratopteris richardii]|uniref:Uncharacterized protein n=1 Tax=Ceratopteris richardii TaxID=49495 RepID=A0A8T2V6I1_CERRI|nr:hypothetical protein KP509_03G040600 [Ceratopteris richardii]KAH7441495.1 hypothetical protein KP509_03G040600 [Ceratopteris richardii]KAH7441496.1 hypothetical protein KP509_03G040600 [Ceratopteris richardii]
MFSNDAGEPIHVSERMAVLMRKSADPPVVCFEEASSPPLEMFVDELPIPPVLDVTTTPHVTLGAYKITQKLHRDLPSTTLYGFGTSQRAAQYPGPTVEARRGVPTSITWENYIEDNVHFLPLDNTLSVPRLQNGGVPIVVHLHGGEVPSYSDGNPDAWYTSRGESGKSFVTETYVYPNSQPAATLWYHDHTTGMNRLNLAAGLLGFYIIRSPEEDENLTLPSGPYEVPLVFQDKRFFPDGRIQLPSIGAVPSIHTAWCPDIFGDTMVVNGKVWPFLNVKARRYRFRMLNGNTERYLSLSISTSTGSALKFIQIGTDGGLLSEPLTLPEITLASAERADVIVDFSDLREGTELYLMNSARAPFPNGNRLPGNTRMLMKFIVVAKTKEDIEAPNTPVPATLSNHTANIRLRGDENVRTHILTDVYTSVSATVPVEFLVNNRNWRSQATEIVAQGSTEIWELINLSSEAHPMHIHLVNHRVLNLQRMDVRRYSNRSCSLNIPYPDPRSCFTELPQPPTSYMVGWKDTVTALPEMMTRIAIKFSTRDGSPFGFDATAPPGYLWHCHLLGHEDNEMMRPLLLT